MTKVVVLDTNVLLADPNVLLSFPRCDVVLPETVLGELDKLKTARVDPDLRFRGREVSRILFDLSEEGSLVEGVELPDGGTLRVAPLDTETALPNGLQARNPDDRILATVYQLRESYGADAEITLVTNDLNMLLKAQTLGIEVQRHGDGTEGGFARRFIIRPFQRYRIPISILAVALAVFGGVIVLVVWGPGSVRSTNSIPPEFRTLLTQQQQQALTYLTTLQKSPNDQPSLLGMANFFYDQNRRAQTDGDAATALIYGQQGLPYYEQYLGLAPKDHNARSDYAALLFYTGQADRAIQQVGTVLKQDPQNVSANFNLGVFYWQGNRQDLKAAANQFKTVIKLTQNDQQKQHAAFLQATDNLAAIQKQAAAQGIALDATGTLVP